MYFPVFFKHTLLLELIFLTVPVNLVSLLMTFQRGFPVENIFRSEIFSSLFGF